MTILEIATDVKYNKKNNELTVKVPKQLPITHKVIAHLGWNHSKIVKDYEVKTGFQPGFTYHLEPEYMDDAALYIFEFLDAKVFKRITGSKDRQSATAAFRLSELLKNKQSDTVEIRYGTYGGALPGRAILASLDKATTVEVEWIDDESSASTVEEMLSHLQRNQTQWYD